MNDIDHRCAKQQHDLAERITRMEYVLARFQRTHRHSLRYRQLVDAYHEAIVELHEMKRAHAKYDRAFQEALADPTGQDLDSFPIGE